MKLEEHLFNCIREEALKLSKRHHEYHNALHVENLRKQERSQTPSISRPTTPPHWASAKNFNPFHVHKNARAIAKSIAKKIETGNYKPHLPEVMKVPKSSGGVREVSIFQIPDAAVSSFYYKQLLAKNKHRFSSFSYAYRDDRNAHFAIQDISVELSQHSRLFVAEFDFSKFFDNISHDYLYEQFDQNGFFISEEERSIIKAFLSSNDDKGIPQGTSISLFLANLACWELDKSLEKTGLQFARYADDTVIWSLEYSKISKAFDLMTVFSKRVGVNLNEEKSDGISILSSNQMPSELSSKKSKIDFLGYSLSAESVSIKQNSVNKIKRQINYILYKHLIQPLNKSPLKALKIPANNKDEALLSCMCEIRRYLYGNLSEEILNSYISGRCKRVFFKGVMSFYPLINDEQQLQALDGWLVDVIYKSIKKRGYMLAGHGQPRFHMMPFKASKSDLVRYCKSTRVNKKRLLKIPSFLVMYKAIQKGLTNLGVEGITTTDHYHGS